MNTITRIAAAAILTLGFAGSAMAQSFPRVVGSGENASVEYGDEAHNIVGGALVRSIGSGESASFEVVDVQHAQNPRHVIATGSGENIMVTLVREFPALTQMALRELGAHRG
jgi:hypothetical protein